MIGLTRRELVAGSAALVAGRAGAHPSRRSVLPTWQSLSEHFRTPDWFRDAKLGIWAHWGPQCVPEWGDWYARKMYQQGNPFYEHHLKTYGHPSQHGFIDFLGQWRADRWDPAQLVQRFKQAGARYVVAMANHHDNFDMFASRHHPWNSTRIGPKRDIVGIWEKLVRAEGLRFGVSNHSAHSWHWLQVAYGYDPEGPRKGVRYDAFRLRRVDGRGTFWEGLDPQQLYGGPSMVPLDGIPSIKAMDEWHLANERHWWETVPANNQRFARQWLARQLDLVQRYRPDLVYFDNEGLPLEHYGLAATAQFYTQTMGPHGLEGVVTGKKLSVAQREAITEDVERGFAPDIRRTHWQTCTCLGDWHYDRKIFINRSYKTAPQVIQRLLDVVSKNGNLLLSVPMRGDGSIDSEEQAVLDAMARWIATNGEAIYGSRPWQRYGEGPTELGTGEAPEFTAQDVRFTVRDGVLYAALLAWPRGPVRISSLALGASPVGAARVSLLGSGQMEFRQTGQGLEVTLPDPSRGQFVPVLRIEGSGIAPFDSRISSSA